MWLAACSPPEPLRLGFIGGLSGPIADLGEAGRDGALLAIEEANAAGGVAGRRVELRILDDAQQPAQAVLAVETLAAEKIELAIGPMTSAMGEAALPTADRLGVLLVSPTITGSVFAGRDDHLFMVSPGVGDMTRCSAAYLYAQGWRRVAIAYDVRNRAFSADWAERFRADFAALGGSVVGEAPFASGEFSSYEMAARRMAANRPDILHFVAGAVDVVRLTQAVRNLGLEQPLSAATWAATEHLVQLGGKSVEGMVLTQLFNRDDASPRFQAFRTAFLARFKQEPGFAAVTAYDATRAALIAYAKRTSGQSLGAALQAAGPYDGLQQRWSFDAHGDATRQTFVAVVRGGRFVRVD